MKIIKYFSNIEFCDFKSVENKKFDYPDVAKNLCQNFFQGDHDFGILICGSGVGMSISANRFSNIRAALCFDEEIAKLSRKHNDANVLCLGARFVSEQKAISIIQTFISSEFSGGRHNARVKKIDSEINLLTSIAYTKVHL
jgi:ribose 5-phosphate isomerase B